MAVGFRIQRVVIEGFKGFASPKEINFKGHHVFLLGQNGNGKSSIVEAIRWGLFGSAGRRNEIIANQHYPGRCRVTVVLNRKGEMWTLRRTLIRGASGGSDAILTDQDGNERFIRDIMPELDSVDAGEGMHIIFAPQSAPLRRRPEDLDPFERTVLNYLGLTHPRAFLSHVKSFLDEQELIEEDLGKELTDARTDIDVQIQMLETSRSHIVNAPPWGSGHPPSLGQSEVKARKLIEDITGNPLDPALEGLSLEALVDSAGEALEIRRIQDESSLEEVANGLDARRELLENLRDIRIRVSNQQSIVQNSRSELQALLAGLTLDQLRGMIEKAKEEAHSESLKSRMIQDALTLLGRASSEEVPCPVCEHNHDRQTLESALQDATCQPSSEINTTLIALESQLQQSEYLRNQLEDQERELSLLKQAEASAATAIDDEDDSLLSKGEDINAIIETLVEKESSVREQIDDMETWMNLKGALVNRLREENRFHQIQNALKDRQIHRQRFQRVEAAYRDLVTFGESVRGIRRVAEDLLNEQLVEKIPSVSEKLSTAFNALTHHPWYNRLVISKDPLPKLELRVASSNDTTGSEYPTGVLNGQAESALHLVPHFTFSQADGTGTPTEVYLVLLDDPTRAYDVAHTEILVERLYELGNHVQLVVASQETERFQSLIPKTFAKDSYVIVEPTSWSHDSGPKLEINYG